MPITPTYPGVYIEELASGVRTIVGVPSSIAAFVGYTARGLDHRPTRLFSYGDFERSFGGLAADSALSYAVQQFFLNGGTDAYVVRVPKADSVAAKVNLKDGASGTTKTSLEVTALSRGAWANDVVIDIDHAGVPDADTKRFNLTITDLVSGATERFPGVTIDSASSDFVKSVVNDADNGSRMVTVAVPAAATARPMDAGTVGGDITLSDLKNDKPYSLKVSADVPAGTFTEVPVTVIEKGEPLPASVAGVCALLERKINPAFAAKRAGAEIRCVPSSNGKGVRVTGNFDPELLASGVDAAITFTDGTPNSAAVMLKLKDAVSNVGRYRLGKGRKILAQDLEAADAGADGTSLPGTEQLVGSEAAFTGIQALRRVDLFTILCIPDATRGLPGDPNTLDSAVQPNTIFAAAARLCAQRRAMLIVDPPPEVGDVATALDWISTGLTSKGPDSAAYFPRLRVADPLNGFRLRSVAPSGTVAGLWARTDAERGVWKAPGGTDARLINVDGLAYLLTDSENGVLNPLGLNCIRSLPVYGTVSWGARTLDGADVAASQWKYLPVRRLAKVIEESVFRGTQWAVFEPNDEPLWSQLRLNLSSYMHGLFRQGAFQGQTPRDAYLVKCDNQTTTQDDIDRGVVNVLVGFAPLKPAEFVFIRIQQLAGQTQS